MTDYDQGAQILAAMNAETVQTNDGPLDVKAAPTERLLDLRTKWRAFQTELRKDFAVWSLSPDSADIESSLIAAQISDHLVAVGRDLKIIDAELTRREQEGR